MPITRAIPHLITALSILATLGLTIMYAQAQTVHRQMAETNYYATGWDAQLIDAAYEALANGEGLPCPARVERTMQGKHGTYVLAGEIKRARFVPGLNHPLPTCEETGDAYIVHLTAGTTQHPHTFQAELLLDLAEVKANPNRLLRPMVRPDQAIVFTSVGGA